jgi:hypothetical protein
MRKDAASRACDVVGCDEPATGSFMRARDARLVAFSICDGHFVRLQLGDRPRVVDDGLPALVLEPVERDD